MAARRDSLTHCTCQDCPLPFVEPTTGTTTRQSRHLRPAGSGSEHRGSAHRRAHQRGEGRHRAHDDRDEHGTFVAADRTHGGYEVAATIPNAGARR